MGEGGQEQAELAMDLFEEAGAGNVPEYSVSELSGSVKRLIEGEFSHVRVRAEVGRVTRPRSGHLYLDLKDERSVIAAVMWKGLAARLEALPEEGMEVIATGKMTTFPGQSRYQIVLEDVRPAGAGALMAMLEKRKAMLAAEGVFDPARKQALPYLPEVIGVVTSPTGAVIRDILHRLRERFARKVLIWPVSVQGQACAGEVVRAIEGFNRLSPGGALPRPDLLIVARGGGSVEDLWGFNEESVARAAAASRIPLISAVGHETDTTLIDHASDQRAPTPTAAAEMAVPVRTQLVAHIEGQGARMTHALAQRLEMLAHRMRDLARALPRAQDLLRGPGQRLDLASERLGQGLRRRVDLDRLRLSQASGSLRPAMLRQALTNEERRLGERNARLIEALPRLAGQRRLRLDGLSGLLRPQQFRRDLSAARERFATFSNRLDAAQSGHLAQIRAQLGALVRLADTLSYKATLARGFVVLRGDGHVLTSKAAAIQAGRLEVEFADGILRLGSGGKKPSQPAPPEQGKLF